MHSRSRHSSQRGGVGLSYDPATLKCGDVLLMVRAHPLDSLSGIVDAGISASTVNPFEHSALVVEEDGSLVLVEALLHVAVSPLDKYVSNGWRLSPTHLSAAKAQILSQAALSKVGQFYGIGMVWQDFLRDDLHLDIHPRIDPRHLDCSGLVVWAFQQAGKILTEAPVPSPADLSYSPILRGRRPW